jgi:EAL domain-containing protein (putative c-di-GMP-specific phosphodiesterase class I)
MVPPRPAHLDGRPVDGHTRDALPDRPWRSPSRLRVGRADPWKKSSVLLHPHEADRLESLRSYGVLDTPPEAAYDGLADLAAMICGTPAALISLVDEQRVWHKANRGPGADHVERELAFCAHVIATQAPLVVSDATADPRFRDNPYVTGEIGLRAYAGVPLIGRDGLPLGTLSVVDLRTRWFTTEQLGALATLAEQVVVLMELRRADALSGRLPSTGAHPLHDPHRLRRALDDGELVPWFQSTVDLATGRPHGLEALLRWQHPELGVQPAHSFLPAIESTALMLPLGRHVLRSSLRVLADLRATRQVSASFGMAVNVSAVQLAEPGLADTVAAELAATSIPPQLLSLELTETAGLVDDAVTRRELHALRELGVQLAIDDYGTGYSGLMRLLELPITALKLDCGLTRRLPYDGRALAVARSTIGMAEDLGIGVVAEGVETRQQQQALLELGCVFGQGHLFDRAAPASSLQRMLVRQPTSLESLAMAQPFAAGPRSEATRWHSVQLYRSDEELVEEACGFLVPSLSSDEGVVLMATAEHLALLAQALGERGLDVLTAREQGRYVELDVADLLGRYAATDELDETGLTTAVEAALASAGRGRSHVRVFGELVPLLWSAGRTADALRLETLWNSLIAEAPVSLHCAFPQSMLDRGGSVHELQELCNAHTAVTAVTAA